MRSARLIAAAALGCAISTLAAGCASGGPTVQRPPTLQPFRDDADYVRFVRQLARSARAAEPEASSTVDFAAVGKEGGSAVALQRGEESITNVQHAGVDEGGIVKVHGDYLVILRRGRLFTVRIGGSELSPVSATDAFGPGIDPSGTWIDEMLVSGGDVVVIGYSYQRGGTEVGLFRIDEGGRLTHRATYQLRSFDYYSSRNYASRLVGGKLVFYAPIPVETGSDDPFASFPAVRRWGAGDTTFHRTAPSTRVYRPAGELSPGDALVLHTVTVCDLGGNEMDCRATALFGPAGRVFYVSPQSVYVWATRSTWRDGDPPLPHSVLYRMPLDGSAPTGLRVSGSPVDQLSFLESGDGFLNVLVQGDGGGEGMWRAEHSGGSLALLRVPVASFGDGSGAAPRSNYRPLPAAAGGPLQNRFVGDWLLYGAGAGWGPPSTQGASVYGVRWAGGGEVAALPLPHAVDRIEAMGSGAVVVGSDGRDLHFSGVRLGRGAALADRYSRPNASQGETRTHGFFYRADGDDAGVLGLPVSGGGRPGYDQLDHGSASVLFLRNQAFRLRELGALAAGGPSAADDACRVSCVDWYGNARPIFLRGRIFALLGYELVEGREDDGRIRELRRVSFAPRAAQAGR